MRSGTRWQTWLERVPAEIIILALGAWLRLSFFGEIRASYDHLDHEKYARWFLEHNSLPPHDLSRLTYGPPLYYMLAGALMRLGVAWPSLTAMSALFGTARLGILWWGLRWAFPNSRSTQLIGLSLAAVLPAAVHIDGMVNNESLSMLATWTALACVVQSERVKSWKWAFLAGLSLAAALLTKFSAIMLLICLVAAVLFDGFVRRNLEAAKRWTIALSVAVVAVGPYYARNRELTGMLFPTAFEQLDAVAISKSVRETPLFARRPTSFFVSLDADIFTKPYYPVGSGSFWSTLMVATFSDHSAYYFSPRGNSPPPEGWSRTTRRLASLSVLGGLLISIAAAGGFIRLFVSAFLRQRTVELILVGTTFLAVLGQLYFATKYPVDHYGVIKGTYLQFATAPLFASFAAGTVSLWERGPLGRTVSMVLGLAVTLVAAYTVTSRLGIS